MAKKLTRAQILAIGTILDCARPFRKPVAFSILTRMYEIRSSTLDALERQDMVKRNPRHEYEVTESGIAEYRKAAPGRLEAMDAYDAGKAEAQPAPDSAAAGAAPAEDVKVAKPGMFNRLLRMQLASLGETDLHTLKQQITAMRQQLAALITEIDMLSLSSSMQVQVAREHLLEKAKQISPEAKSLMADNAELRQERDKLLKSEDAYHQENERLRAALEDLRKLAADAPEHGIGYDQLRMEVLTRIANTLDGEDAAIDVQMKLG